MDSKRFVVKDRYTVMIHSDVSCACGNQPYVSKIIDFLTISLDDTNGKI